MAVRRDPAVQKLNALKLAAVQARMPAEREAWLNLAFYLDEQYVSWNDSAKTINRIPRDPKDPDAPRPIVNKIMHFVQQERSMLLQAKPTPDVLPATDDLLDITNTAVGNGYVKYVAEPTQANFNRRLNKASLWALIGGSAYLKWVWDPAKKRPAIIPCSIFEIAADPYVTEFEDARYVIHTKFMSLEEAQEKFPDANLREAQAEQADPMRTELLAGMGSAPVVSGVSINEIWYRPCKKYPDGMYSVWTSDQMLVSQDKLPYDHKRLPFTFIGAIERPDSQYWHSPVKYLRSGQMQFNLYWAQRITIRRKFANPKWWIPNELDLEQDPDDSPAQILRGAGGSGLMPMLIQPTVFPAADDAEQIEQQMMHIVGLHEVSQAQVPGRVEAAKAIELLKESDADRQATMLETISAAISEGWYQVLMLAKQYESEDTILQTYSREGLPEVQRFKAEAIKPAMRVIVTMGTGLARSRAARHDEAMNLWDRKIITDQDQMAELLEIPIPTFTASRALDLRLARNENLELAKDNAIVANSWDDHAVHLREHNNWRKTQEYITASDSVKNKFEFHCTRHEELQLVQARKMAELMAVMQPVQPQPGGGAAPSTPPAQPTPA